MPWVAFGEIFNEFGLANARSDAAVFESFEHQMIEDLMPLRSNPWLCHLNANFF